MMNGRDHSTILYALRKYAVEHGEIAEVPAEAVDP
jgi:hypothetical protein